MLKRPGHPGRFFASCCQPFRQPMLRQLACLSSLTRNFHAVILILAAVSLTLSGGVLYQTGFETTDTPPFTEGVGTVASPKLVGTDNWTMVASANPAIAVSSCYPFAGIDNYPLLQLGQTAALGCLDKVTMPPTGTQYIRVARKVDAQPSGLPIIDFYCQIGLTQSTNGHSDDFELLVYNWDDKVLGGLTFDLSRNKLYRYDANEFNDTTYVPYTDTGLSLSSLYDTVVEVTMRINYQTNTWTATVGGVQVVSGATFTLRPTTGTTGAARTFGSLSARWYINTLGTPGNNWMLFNDWTITNSTPTIPATASASYAANSTASIAVTDAGSVGWSVSSDQAWALVSPTSGSGSGTVTVTCAANPNSVTRTATITVGTQTCILTQAAAPSTIATLSALSLSSGTLTPAFAALTTSYTASVPNATASVTMTPTVTDPTATVKVNGTTVASGAASGAISLLVGPNTITTVVTAQDGTTTKTYTVIVTRISTVSTLSALTLSSGTLSPSFASIIKVYTASVANSITGLTVTPTLTNVYAAVKVNGTAVASGVPSASIPLVVGSNLLTVLVTAQDGTSTSTYTVTVTRAASAVSTLSALALSSGTLSPTFAPLTTSYAASVPNATASVTVTPTATDVTATIKVNGTAVTSGTASAAISLAVGANTITAVVTAQDGTTIKTYTVTVTRAASAVSTLSALALSSGILTPTFAAGTYIYTASVTNGTSSITVTPTLTDVTATIKVNGTTVASGTASGAISLVVGTNTITTVVTAQDGTTIRTYTVTVTRTASAVSTLSALALSSGTLTPTFAAATTSYTASVTNATTSVTVTPTVTDATATIKVNGTAVTSGTASAAISLTVGANTITTVVTAQDGTTTKTYTTTVTRASSSSGYAAWIATYPGLTDTTASGDPDHDGIPNLLEYVLNGNPGKTSTAILPAVAKVANSFIFTFSRQVVSAQDTTQVFQYSSDLSHWTDVLITSPTDSKVSLGVADANGMQTVTVTIPAGTKSTLFGRLQVTGTDAGVSGYAAWIATYTGLTDTSASGDPDHDGIPNLLEYVLNGNPGKASTSILPAVKKVANNFVFTFSRRVTSAQDTTQIFQYSSDMSHWTDVLITSPTDTKVSLGVADANGMQSVTVTIPQGANSTMFGRLKVTLP